MLDNYDQAKQLIVVVQTRTKFCTGKNGYAYGSHSRLDYMYRCTICVDDEVTRCPIGLPCMIH